MLKLLLQKHKQQTKRLLKNNISDTNKIVFITIV